MMLNIVKTPGLLVDGWEWSSKIKQILKDQFVPDIFVVEYLWKPSSWWRWFQRRQRRIRQACACERKYLENDEKNAKLHFWGNV